MVLKTKTRKSSNRAVFIYRPWSHLPVFTDFKSIMMLIHDAPEPRVHLKCQDTKKLPIFSKRKGKWVLVIRNALNLIPLHPTAHYKRGNMATL
jgi:hypothetical protein